MQIEIRDREVRKFSLVRSHPSPRTRAVLSQGSRVPSACHVEARFTVSTVLGCPIVF